MTDTSARLNKAIADAKKGDNTLYTIILYYFLSMRGTTVESIDHKAFIETTEDVCKLRDIITSGYVEYETANEIFIEDVSRFTGELSAYNAMQLADEIGATIQEARALARELHDLIGDIPREPR